MIGLISATGKGITQGPLRTSVSKYKRAVRWASPMLDAERERIQGKAKAAVGGLAGDGETGEVLRELVVDLSAVGHGFARAKQAADGDGAGIGRGGGGRGRGGEGFTNQAVCAGGGWSAAGGIEGQGSVRGFQVNAFQLPDTQAGRLVAQRGAKAVADAGQLAQFQADVADGERLVWGSRFGGRSGDGGGRGGWLRRGWGGSGSGAGDGWPAEQVGDQQGGDDEQADKQDCPEGGLEGGPKSAAKGLKKCGSGAARVFRGCLQRFEPGAQAGLFGGGWRKWRASEEATGQVEQRVVLGGRLFGIGLMLGEAHIQIMRQTSGMFVFIHGPPR